MTVQELLEHPFLRPTEAPGGPQPGQVGLTRDQLKKLLTQVANPHTAYVSDYFCNQGGPACCSLSFEHPYQQHTHNAVCTVVPIHTEWTLSCGMSRGVASCDLQHKVNNITWRQSANGLA